MDDFELANSCSTAAFRSDKAAIEGLETTLRFIRERELRQFDAALENAVKQATRRVHECVERNVAAAVPKQCKAYVESSTQYEALKINVLGAIDRQLVQRCEATLSRYQNRT